MKRYLFLSDPGQHVLGVWETCDDIAAARLRLQLTLTYPGLKTHSDRAFDFEELRARHGDLNFADLEPEQLGSLSYQPLHSALSPSPG